MDLNFIHPCCRAHLYVNLAKGSRSILFSVLNVLLLTMFDLNWLFEENNRSGAETQRKCLKACAREQVGVYSISAEMQSCRR
jgi:hypothetical protein